jgi:hypothetical protein
MWSLMNALAHPSTAEGTKCTAAVVVWPTTHSSTACASNVHNGLHDEHEQAHMVNTNHEVKAIA